MQLKNESLDEEDNQELMAKWAKKKKKYRNRQFYHKCVLCRDTSFLEKIVSNF